MAYGHAERNLAVIRQLEAETTQLLGRLAHNDEEHPACPGHAADAAAEP